MRQARRSVHVGGREEVGGRAKRLVCMREEGGGERRGVSMREEEGGERRRTVDVGGCTRQRKARVGGKGGVVQGEGGREEAAVRR